MKVLKALGFNEKFFNLIYQCISIDQYSLLLNVEFVKALILAMA